MIQQELTATQAVVPVAAYPEVLQRACAGCSARLTQAIVPTFPEDTVGLSRHSSPPTEPAGHPPAAKELPLRLQRAHLLAPQGAASA